VAQVARSQQEFLDVSPSNEDGRVKTRDRAPDPLIGRVIADRYRIVGHLGRGGMGIVYKVEHLRIGKLMAMKLLTGELSRNREVVRRFKREALAASRLTSVNTVQVWDFGHSDGLTYLVMELVAGEDLGKLLKREGPMPFRRVAQIAVQVCNSMREAHERGIVHRDIKPENILIVHPSGNPESDPDESGAHAEARQLTDLVKVLDFGLAKVHDEERPHTNDVTTAGAIVGTPYYMSPEQIRGETVDGRADIYALGAVMYRAVTGVPPFVAPTPMAVITQHLTEELIPPHERAPELNIPREVSDIILRAMAKDRDQRYGSASELREALITHLASLGVSGGFLRTGALETIAAAAGPEALRTSRADVEVPLATRKEVSAYSRRRRRAGLIATAIALATVATILIAARTMRSTAKPQHAFDEESEPNDTTANANALTLGSPSKGYIGKRLDTDRGDLDFWSIEVPGVNPLLEIALSPLPNMPLCVDLFRDPTAAAPVATFCRPRGVALHVNAFRVQPGRYWLRVSQDRSLLEDGSKPPVYENVSDMYSLRVAIASTTPDLEIEPNDGLADARTMIPGDTVNGSLGWRGDRDFYCAESGRFAIDRGGRIDIETFVDGASKGRVSFDGAWKSPPIKQRTCIAIGGDDSYRVTVEK
jgi:eukaryotic-like serine/threonine-protein kinase